MRSIFSKKTRWQPRTTLLALSALTIAAGIALDHFIIGASRAGAEEPTTPPAGRPVDAERDFPQDRTPLQREAGVVSYAATIERASPSVVAVYTSHLVRVARFGGHDPRQELLERFFGVPFAPAPDPRGRGQGVPEAEERKLPAGTGSGVIVSADGYILTNNHVITGNTNAVADEILIRLSDGRELPAEVVGRDPKTDVAVLKVDPAQPLPHAALGDSDDVVVGDVAFAIGNPLGVGKTVTMGIVSATGRSGLGIIGENAYEYFIQTDASINPGNSGGALVDATGRLIGINTAIVSRSGGNIGIGFAIPVNLARAIMVDLIEDGTIQRGFLGVGINDLTPDLAEAFGLEGASGALVQQVEEDTPAERAGVERGDVVTAVDGRPIRDSAQLRLLIAQTPPGAEIELTLLRKGEEKRVRVKLDDLEGSAVAGGGGELFDGVAASPVNPDLAERYRLPEDISGLVVTAVEVRSPYAGILREGMVVVEINDRPARSISAARRALRQGVNKFWVYDRGFNRFIAVRTR